MLSFRYFVIGTPFNPTAGETKMAFPAKHRLSPQMKHLKGAHLHKMTADMIIEKALQFDKDNQGLAEYEHVTIFGGRLGAEALDTEQRKADMQRQLSAILKLNRDGKKLGLMTMEGEFYREYRQAHSKNPHVFTYKWMKASREWLMDQGDELSALMNKQIKESHSQEDILKSYLDNDIELVRFVLGSRYLLMRYSTYEGDEIEKGILFIAALFAKTLKATTTAERIRGIKYIWNWGFMMECQELIPYLYTQMRDFITPERFPFLNFFVLKKVDKQLHSTHAGLPILKQIYYSSEIARVEVSAANAAQSSIPSVGYSLLAGKLWSQLEHSSLLDMVKSDLGTMSQYLTDMQGELKKVMKTGNALAAVEKMAERMVLPASWETQLHDLSLVSPHFLTLKQRRTDVLRYIMAVMELWEGNKNATTARVLQEKIDNIESEAKTLGQDPLNNALKLGEMKAKHDDYQSQLTSLMDDIKERSEQFLNDIVTSADKYLTTLQGIVEPEVESEAVVPLSQLQRVEADLHDERMRRNELEEKLQRANATTTPPPVTAAAVDNHAIITHVTDYARNASLYTAFTLLEAMHSDVVISPSAWRAIKDNKVFTRHDQVLELMNTLLSDDFLSTYQTQGSQACFALIPNKRLSFSESETVDNANLRNYEFSDGKTRTCNAHLRFGISNDAATMLRIYFTIEDGAVYIGDVTKHAPLNK